MGAFRGYERPCVTGAASIVEALLETTVGEVAGIGGERSQMTAAGDSGTLSEAGGSGDFDAAGFCTTSGCATAIPERVRPLNSLAK